MKYIIKLFMIIMLIFLVTACGAENTNSDNALDNNSGSPNNNSGSSEETSDSEGNSDYSGESYQWKLGFNTPEDSTRGAAAKAFKEVVESKTNGNVTVELFAGEILGSEQEMLEQVESGAMELQLAGGSGMQNIVPEYAVLALPFMVETFDEAYAVLDGEIGDELRDKAYEKGFKVLTHTDLGMVQLTNSKHPIHNPDDLSDLKIRSPEEPTSIMTFEQLGASVTTMPLTEVYMGLQQGVIDGQFNPLDAIYENNIHEVQDYLTMTNHFYYHVNFIMNRDLYDSLDPELQAIVDEAAVESQKASREYTQQKDKEMLDILQNEFVEIVTDPDLEAFRSKIDYEPFYEFVGEDILKKTQAFIEDYRK